MKMILTRGRYALRAMLDLAEQDAEKFIPLEEIAERQALPKKYLEVILKTLTKSGLLEVKSGKGGGYKLTRSPAEYTVGEILELTENTLSIVECLSTEKNTCERRAQCLTLPMWEKFNQITRDFFYGITLADILREKK